MAGRVHGRARHGAAAGALCALWALAVTGCGGGDHAAARDEAVRRAERVVAATRAAGPLPAGAFRARIFVPAPPARMRAGQREAVRVRVRNDSDGDWPAEGRGEDGYFQVNLGNIWRDAAGRKVEDAGYVRSSFPAAVRPGEEVELTLVVNAPKTPGEYALEIDLVQEMVGWFRDRGSESFITTVRVE